MSTENTTTQGVGAAQVQVQPAVNIITDTIPMKAKEIYAQMSQFGQHPKAYSETSSMKGESYYTFKCKGAMINVPPDFQKAFVEKKLYSITITGKPYARKVADATVAGGERIQIEQSWTYDSHMTIEDYKAAMVNDAEISMLEAALEIKSNEVQAVTKAAKSVKVTPEREKSLMDELNSLLKVQQTVVAGDDDIDDEEAA